MQTPEEKITLTETIEKLKQEGFTEEFIIRNQNLISNSGREFNPEDVTIVKFYRFEGNSDPGDMSVLYAIKSSSGIKGIFIDAFGTYADQDGQEVSEVLNRIKIMEDH